MLLLRPDLEVSVPMLGLLQPGDPLPVVVDLGRAEDPHCSAARALSSDAATFGEAIDSWRRRSGIPRPSSAARASIAAAMVCRSLVEAGGWAPARLDIVTASTTSAARMAVTFETRGLSEGWNAVDPLLLPSTLPSALATQVAMAVGARGFVASCIVGLLGVFHALEMAVLGLIRGDADVVLVVVADERTPVQQVAHGVLEWEHSAPEFAGALALVRQGGWAWRMAFVGYDSSPEGPLPNGWEAAARHHVAAPYTGASMQCGSVLLAMSRALKEEQHRVVVTGSVPGLGSASVGFEWVQCLGHEREDLVPDELAQARPRSTPGEEMKVGHS